MLNILEDLKSVIEVEKIIIDNVIFQLHYTYTVLLIFVFIIIIVIMESLMDPVQCFHAKELPNAIVNTYCSIHQPYIIPQAFNKKVGNASGNAIAPGIDDTQDESKYFYLTYYQWVVSILFLQAILFYIPRWLWIALEDGTVRTLATVLKFGQIEETKKLQIIQILADYFICNWKTRNWYTRRYFFIQCLYILNLIGQVMLLNAALNNYFFLYGFKVMGYYNHGGNLDPMIRVFPRITRCTVRRYGQGGSIEQLDALCVMTLNNIFDKVFLFLWIWFWILFILTCFAIMFNLLLVFVPQIRIRALCYFYNFERRKHVRVIVRESSFGDWFLLYQLGKNVDLDKFRDLVRVIAERIEYLKRPVEERKDEFFQFLWHTVDKATQVDEQENASLYGRSAYSAETEGEIDDEVNLRANKNRSSTFEIGLKICLNRPDVKQKNIKKVTTQVDKKIIKDSTLLDKQHFDKITQLNKLNIDKITQVDEQNVEKATQVDKQSIENISLSSEEDSDKDTQVEDQNVKKIILIDQGRISNLKDRVNEGSEYSIQVEEVVADKDDQSLWDRIFRSYQKICTNRLENLSLVDKVTRKNVVKTTQLDEQNVDKITQVSEKTVDKTSQVEEQNVVTQADEQLVDVITQADEQLVDKVTQADEQLVDKVTQADEQPVDKVTQADEQLVDKVTQVDEQLVDKVIQADEQPVDKVTQADEQLVDNVTQADEQPVDKVTQADEQPVDKVMQADEQLVDKVTQAEEQLHDKVTQVDKQSFTQLDEQHLDKFVQVYDQNVDKKTQVNKQDVDKITQVDEQNIDNVTQCARQPIEKFTQTDDSNADKVIQVDDSNVDKVIQVDNRRISSLEEGPEYSVEMKEMDTNVGDQSLWNMIHRRHHKICPYILEADKITPKNVEKTTQLDVLNIDKISQVDEQNVEKSTQAVEHNIDNVSQLDDLNVDKGIPADQMKNLKSEDNSDKCPEYSIDIEEADADTEEQSLWEQIYRRYHKTGLNRSENLPGVDTVTQKSVDKTTQLDEENVDTVTQVEEQNTDESTQANEPNNSNLEDSLDECPAHSVQIEDEIVTSAYEAVDEEVEDRDHGQNEGSNENRSELPGEPEAGEDDRQQTLWARLYGSYKANCKR